VSDVQGSLEIALALIRGDLDRISRDVEKDNRKMDMGESIAVVRYTGALVDAQKADVAASREAEKEASRMSPAQILAKMREMVGARDLLDRDDHAGASESDEPPPSRRRSRPG